VMALVGSGNITQAEAQPLIDAANEIIRRISGS